ncbi:MAG TPA: peptidoglycan DD-metalloendopeptidase family protein [Burkholderiales bacterium]|nr:peptidoglycan DD-metalloendopeptidase family protein [Burkholderiales bacterium]
MKLALAVLAVLLAGCASRAPAPVDDRRPAPTARKPPAAQVVQAPGGAAPAGRPGTYVVKRGDTLYSIALENGADYRDLALWNKLEDPSKIRVGQELRVAAPEERATAQVGAARLPGAIEARPIGPGTAAAPAASEAGMKTSPRALRLPYSEQNLAALSRPEAGAAAKPEANPEAKPEAKPAEPPKQAAVERPADAIDFIWPAKGRVLAGFSEPRNKGVDIEGKLGDPVVAAAAGRVIYVGSGIPGLGKFIVLRHENGFNTVYAHNRENLVKMDQNIARGQKIGEIGSTDSDTPMLHFQIRKFGTPLDPQKYLPPS